MGEWISVNERLPDENGKYLCCWDGACGGVRYIGIYSFAKNLNEIDMDDFPTEKRPGWYNCNDDGWGYYETHGITHWMPLPALPDKN